MIILIGLVIALAGGMIMAFDMPLIVFGVGVCILGVMRLVRQFKTAKRCAQLASSSKIQK